MQINTTVIQLKDLQRAKHSKNGLQRVFGAWAWLGITKAPKTAYSAF